jgi:hypothetical protein
VRRLDTTQHLGNAKVGRQVGAAVLFRGPAFLKRADVSPQFVADRETIGRRHSRFLVRPSRSFQSGDGLPVAPNERDEILFSHEARIAFSGAAAACIPAYCRNACRVLLPFLLRDQ